jgi:hypothetical protein
MAFILETGAASALARLAVRHVGREYPNKLDHVMTGSEDVRSPRELHPVFYGSFDWHSCVHGYWLLLRLYRRFPALSVREAIRAVADEHLVEEKISREITYLRQSAHKGFERPYGWAWALALTAELALHDSPEGQSWFRAVSPLAEAIVRRFEDYLPRATYPVRSGTHANSAFAVALALEYAETIGNRSFADLLRGRASSWFASDTDSRCWEPSGEDFLSPTLVEAECMRRLLPANDFAVWFERFLPDLGERQPRTLFEPARVGDRNDGRIVHLDGLNLSRAWCWASIASSWPYDHPKRALALTTADAHLQVSLPHVSGDYMGEHWLATFALLALEARG